MRPIDQALKLFITYSLSDVVFKIHPVPVLNLGHPVEVAQISAWVCGSLFGSVGPVEGRHNLHVPQKSLPRFKISIFSFPATAGDGRFPFPKGDYKVLPLVLGSAIRAV